jgi:small-conductance mechanosensitive channel
LHISLGEIGVSEFWEIVLTSFEGTGLSFAIAFGILILGWIFAGMVRRLLLRIFDRTRIDDQIAAWLKQEDPTELNQRIARITAIFIRLLTIVIFGFYAYEIEPIKILIDALIEQVGYLSTLPGVVFIFDIILLAILTWVLIRLIRVINQFFEQFYQVVDGWRGTRIKSIKIQRLELLTEDRLTDGLILIMRYVRILVLILLGLVFISIVFSFFPPTRDIIQGLLTNIWGAVVNGWQGFVDYLPSLLNLILIFFITRYVLRFVHFIADEVGKGNITLGNFYPEWAEPTYQLIRILLVALALVIAFPFLPGSDSPAFQGISIFLGFLFSLGSTSVVANVIAGIVLTYTRAFKVGDRVKIADTIGDIRERTLFVTRIRTIKNVDITIPNGMVLSSHIINYSSSANKTGLILHTTITIGYDVPWPRVHEMLIDAALSTEYIQKSPQPFVFQTSLDDYYVSYEINAYTDAPNQMAYIYSELHKNIQDKFNQAGIEILSPMYGALRDGNKSSIPENYKPEG